jgi:hypothetical protein
MPTTHSGFMVQSNRASGDFELVVADRANARIAHCRRNNEDPELSWIGPRYFGVGTIRGLSLIQSNFGSPSLGNLEVIANDSGRLAHYWCEDHSPYTWHGPFYIADAQVSGNPALIQSRFGVRGHFELVTPPGGSQKRGLLHFRRNNDRPDLPWEGPTLFASALADIEAVGLIQSNFGDPGNLEAIVRVGEELLHLWFDGSTWVEPVPFFRGAAGAPGFIQSHYGTCGNFEIVTPLEAGGMAHFWRNNDDALLPGVGPTIFGAELKDRVDAVALIQNTRAPVGRDNLEVAACIGDRTCHFWRKPQPPFEQPPSEWHGPSTFMCKTGPS